MSPEEEKTVSEVHLRLEEAETLLRSLIDEDTADEGLRDALEAVHVATINFNGFVSDIQLI